MIPLRITLEGFMSYREKQTLDFDGHALWVLSGHNGAGKSAVFDAITFALYGQYRGGEQQHATRLINNQGVPALKVAFEFQVGPRIYKVHRTHPRKGSGTWEAFELLNGDWERIEGEDSVRRSDDWTRRTIGLSYEAFTSSVLLLQGHSERLLKAKPVKRYDILSELIEMAPYQELEERAERARGLHEATVKRLDGELQSLPVVSGEALQQATDAVHIHEKALQEAERDSERRVRIHSGALNHERLVRQYDERFAQLNDDKSLLARAEEIRSGLSRFKQLDAVLGTLESIAKLQLQLKDGSSGLAQLESEFAASTLREKQLGSALIKKEEVAGELQEQLVSCQSKLGKIQERLTTLAPIVEGLRLIEEQEVKLAQLSERLTRFPDDLILQREEARNKAVLIEEARDALNILDSLTLHRKELLEAEDEEQSTQQQADAARSAAEEIAKEEVSLTAQRKQVHERQHDLERELSGTLASHEILEVQLKEFADAAEQKLCSLCGQRIDERHAEKEKSRLLDQASVLRSRIAAMKEQQGTESESAGVLDEQLKKLQGRKAQVDKELGEAQSILKGLPARLEKTRKKLVADFVRLPQAHQVRIWPQEGSSAVPWRETRYPAPEDLSALKRQADGRSAHSRHMRALDEQHEQCVVLRSQVEQTRETLGSLTKEGAKETRVQARQEQRTLHEERQRRQQDSQSLDRRYAEIAAAVRTQRTELQELKQQQQQQERARVEKQTLIRGWEEQRQQQVDQLPDAWKEKGGRLTAKDLMQVKSEHAELKDSVQEEAMLVTAEKRQSTINARLDELKRQIDAIPQEERAAVADVTKMLEAAKAKQKDFDARWRKSHQALAELERAQDKRSKLEHQHREETRKYHLYKRLARLLGREELQRSLMRATERELVILANVILSDLSRTRMQLRLRHEDSATSGGKAQEKQKALDLEFRNTDTGSDWMDIELASGSQSFRIAISLALAMGTYFGRDARRVESVIIDEGFGCLDKVNREDTIEVLNALQGTMKRIILVSHQDEFSHEFKNGYEVRLEEKSSRVSRMVI